MGMLNLARSNNSTSLVRPALVLILGIGTFFPGLLMAGQIDSSAYFHLRRGMSESEVLVRAGPPDLVTSPGHEAIEVKSGVVDRGEDGDVTFDSFRRTRIPTLSSWHYVPGPGETDPFITIVTFRAGEVWELQRTKVFSRYKKPTSDPSASDRGSVTDSDIQRQRADNTVKAAEAYAATRAKLKKEQAEASNTATHGSAKVYKGVQPDGSTYFGDTPP